MVDETTGYATEVKEVGFVEFTTDLINSVFDAVIAANLEQTESYLKLLKTVSSDLTTYINDTEGEVSNSELIAFINSVSGLPEKFGASETRPITDDDLSDDGTIVVEAGEENKALNTALTIASLVPAAGAAVNVVGALASGGATGGVSGIIAKSADVLSGGEKKATVAKPALLDAIAQKIASDKYSLLQEMVKLGIMRTVIESGTIETRVIFKTMERRSESTENKERVRDVDKRKSRTRGRLSDGNEMFRRARGRNKSKDRTVTVTTAKEKDSEKSGADTKVFGRVVINFRTDYQPVSTA